MEAPGTQRQEPAAEALSVSAALALAKEALESFTVKLVGEVSEVSNKPGYKAVYFSVKDARSSLPCMVWLNRYKASGIDLRPGMLVELTGRFSLYAPKGRMNFDVFSLSVAGEGTLRLKVAELAKRMAAEGLCAQERKRPLPAFPQTIGLVTSPRGAAVHDVLRTLRRRYPVAGIVLAGVAVEGTEAPKGIIRALEAVEAAGAEVILLVRGGGSFEDLMPFNDEGLARAVARAKVPVVTGIGHEPDTSIADMVADVRASTPTGAAQAASPARDSVEQECAARMQRMCAALSSQIERRDMGLGALARRPVLSDPDALFAVEAQTADLLEERLMQAIPRSLETDALHLARLGQQLSSLGTRATPRFGLLLEHLAERHAAQGRGFSGRWAGEVALAASRLDDLSPLSVLARGYALARDSSGQVLKSARTPTPGDHISVDLADGSLACTVNGVRRMEHTLITLGGTDG